MLQLNNIDALGCSCLVFLAAFYKILHFLTAQKPPCREQRWLELCKNGSREIFRIPWHARLNNLAESVELSPSINFLIPFFAFREFSRIAQPRKIRFFRKLAIRVCNSVIMVVYTGSLILSSKFRISRSIFPLVLKEKASIIEW